MSGLREIIGHDPNQEKVTNRCHSSGFPIGRKDFAR
jgi:hypothetical protein